MDVKALTFDVFGTVVDWRGGITREIAALGAARGFSLDWNAFAQAWRARYQPAMERVRGGERGLCGSQSGSTTAPLPAHRGRW